MSRGIVGELIEAMPIVAYDLEYSGYPSALRTLFAQQSFPENDYEGTVVDPDRTRHSGLRALINVHNFLLGETVEVEGEAHIDAEYGNTRPSACSNAELYFLKLARNINPNFRTGYPETYSDDFLKRATVITDCSGEPLLIKKYYESETALALKPISLRGFPIPTGAILGVDLNGQDHGYTGFEEDKTETEKLVETLGGGLLRLIDASEVSKIRPIRLTVFAERRRTQRFGLRKYNSGLRKAWHMSRFDIAQIQDATGEAIAVAQPVTTDRSTR